VLSAALSHFVAASLSPIRLGGSSGIWTDFKLNFGELLRNRRATGVKNSKIRVALCEIEL
jgi:hypothetical protein